MTSAPKPLTDGLRVIALFEAAKGLLVLLAGFGVLGLLHRDLQAFAEHLVQISHLNPASKYPRIFIEAADNVTDTQLWWIAAGAAGYSVLRGVEAYGLWFGRAWAEWLALVAGGLYVPLEIYHSVERFTWLRMAVLLTNLGIVAVMAAALIVRRREAREALGDKL